MEARFITTEETYPLRLKVLRPGGTLADLYWSEDKKDGRFHIGIAITSDLICVGSFYPEAHPSIPARASYRLRGMATDPVHRGKGAGRLLISSALDHLCELGSDKLWCNARIVAVPFYERLGFVTIGQEFDIPGIGGHYLMWKSIDK